MAGGDMVEGVVDRLAGLAGCRGRRSGWPPTPLALTAPAATGTWLSITGHTFEPPTGAPWTGRGPAWLRGPLRQARGGDLVAAWEQWGLAITLVDRAPPRTRPPCARPRSDRPPVVLGDRRVRSTREFGARARRACFAPAPSGGRCGIRIVDRRIGARNDAGIEPLGVA